MEVYREWKDAHTAAVKLARRCKCDVGIEAAKEFNRKVHRIFLLPRPENRYGYELRCEVVRQEDPL